MTDSRRSPWESVSSAAQSVLNFLGKSQHAATKSLSDDQTEAIDHLLDDALDADGAGAVVTITDQGQVVYQRAIGYADTDDETPLTPQSVFDLASCSKHFTGMAVLLLVERSILSLDDDVCQYVPELTHKGQKPIRVVDLLHMVSGLAIYTDFMDDVSAVDNVAIAKAVAKKPLAFTTGTRYEYNNTDYALAALVMERASNQRFARFMQESVFGPLGMRQTFVMDAPALRIPNRVTGYTFDDDEAFIATGDDAVAVGDGNVFSSAADLILWERALRHHTLLKPETQRLAETSGRLASGAKTEYGFGWNIPNDNPDLIWHVGSWDGTATYMSRNLDAGWALTILANDDTLEVGDLAGEIEDVLVEEDD